MNIYAIFAFVVTPAVVVLGALILFVVDEYNFRKRYPTHSDEQQRPL
jgi:hypothetical protein